jgi:hypothetical protein
MKKLLLLSVILFAGIGNAQTIQEMEDFSKIKIDTDAQVEIIYSSKSQVLFNKDSEDLNDFTITSKDDSLVIIQNSKESVSDLKIRIYTDDINAIAVTGNSLVTLSKFSYQDKMVVIAKQGATVDTGDTEIKNLQVIRSNDSKVICLKAKKMTEMVDGLMAATN